MDTLSVWRGTAPPTGFGLPPGDASTDVLVIGGGITGLTVATLLAEQGRQGVLLEAAGLGSGSTGNSTGNLYETVSEGMRQIVSRWGADVARQVAAERRSAVAFIEQRCALLPEAVFRRCPMTVYAFEESQQSQVEQEIDALAQAGCPVERAAGVPPPLPAPAGTVLVLRDQAQFQPQGYVAALAQVAAAAGVRIHERSPVLELDTKQRRAVTGSGTITAQEIVLATHTPKGVHLVHAEMPVHREYGIALDWPSDAAGPGAGVFHLRGSDRLSVRTLDTSGRSYLICVGQEHKVGIHNARAGLMALEQQARRHFGDAPVLFRWSAQSYRGADSLPYIGRNASGCFVATGFATDGLVWGTVAARLIVAQLGGQAPAFGELVRPNRLSPIKGGRNILDENTTVVRQLVKDYLTDRQGEKLAALAPGDSAIVEAEGESVAAWRSPGGELFAVSNVCTHLGCKVHWNSVETSWDCPCHGSRFTPDGLVIEGPALAPLKRKHVKALA